MLAPNDPQYFWMDQLIERDFSHIKPFTKQDLDRSWKLHRCYPLPLRILAKIKNFPHRRASRQSWALHKRYPFFIRMQVRNNRPRGPKGAALSMLRYLCQRYPLPDLDFIYNQHDGLFDTPAGDVPIFTGARANNTRNSILFTDWYFHIASPDKDWNRAIHQIDRKLSSTPWESRQDKLFWRGNTTDVSWCEGLYTLDNWHKHPRAKAYLLSQSHPHLIDAAFTRIWPYEDQPRHPLHKLLPTVPTATLEQHLEYKYQLQITGIMANFPRDRWQFYSRSLVFRHNAPHEMYWYSLLKPWEHYIPIANDLSDLLEKIHWAKTHDAQAKAIADQARRFVQTHLMPQHIALYCYKALLRYKTLMP